MRFSRVEINREVRIAERSKELGYFAFAKTPNMGLVESIGGSVHALVIS
jgi:hypothetical protein